MGYTTFTTFSIVEQHIPSSDCDRWYRHLCHI